MFKCVNLIVAGNRNSNVVLAIIFAVILQNFDFPNKVPKKVSAKDNDEKKWVMCIELKKLSKNMTKVCM